MLNMVIRKGIGNAFSKKTNMRRYGESDGNQFTVSVLIMADRVGSEGYDAGGFPGEDQ